MEGVELTHGENIQFVRLLIFNEYENENKIIFFNEILLFLFKIVHRPIQIQGKSRVDTWRKQQFEERSHSQKVCMSFSNNLNQFLLIDFTSTDTNRR